MKIRNPRNSDIKWFNKTHKLYIENRGIKYRVVFTVTFLQIA